MMHYQKPKVINAFIKALKETYKQGLKNDEYLTPLVAWKDNSPYGRIKDGDVVILCFSRGEREIQLTQALLGEAPFSCQKFANLKIVTLVNFHHSLNVEVAFSRPVIQNNLGEILSKFGIKQARIAESEKGAHIGKFLSGGKEEPYPGEERIIIPTTSESKKRPEMNLAKVTEIVKEKLSSKNYPFIAVNIANADVFGHFPDENLMDACVSVIDKYLGEIVKTAQQYNYITLITADHGVIEIAHDPKTGKMHLGHTTNPVPFVVVPPPSLPENAFILKNHGKLANVAPTILDIFSLPKPKDMTEESLLLKKPKIENPQCLLIILDGWGYGTEGPHNPIWRTPTPNWDAIIAKYPWVLLAASGEAVGKLPNAPGNSEAGHENIGAGRVVLQADVLLAKDFINNPVLEGAIKTVKERGTNLHLLGILSHKSSHGKIKYIENMLVLAARRNFNSVYIHGILDGRSAPTPTSGPQFLEELSIILQMQGVGNLVTLIGRNIALDRNQNWRKTEIAYRALVFGEGVKVLI